MRLTFGSQAPRGWPCLWVETRAGVVEKLGSGPRRVSRRPGPGLVWFKSSPERSRLSGSDWLNRGGKIRFRLQSFKAASAVVVRLTPRPGAIASNKAHGSGMASARLAWAADRCSQRTDALTVIGPFAEPALPLLISAAVRLRQSLPTARKGGAHSAGSSGPGRIKWHDQIDLPLGWLWLPEGAAELHDCHRPCAASGADGACPGRRLCSTTRCNTQSRRTPSMRR